MYNNEKNNYNWEVKIMKSEKKVREKNIIFGNFSVFCPYFLEKFQLSHIQCKTTVLSNFSNIYFSYTFFYIFAKLLEKIC